MQYTGKIYKFEFKQYTNIKYNLWCSFHGVENSIYKFQMTNTHREMND